MESLRIKAIDNDMAERIMANGPLPKKQRATAKRSPRPHSTYRGSPGHIPAKLPTIRAKEKAHYPVVRFGKLEARPLIYKPNGERECMRRQYQLAKRLGIAGAVAA